MKTRKAFFITIIWILSTLTNITLYAAVPIHTDIYGKCIESAVKKANDTYEGMPYGGAFDEIGKPLTVEDTGMLVDETDQYCLVVITTNGPIALACLVDKQSLDCIYITGCQDYWEGMIEDTILPEYKTKSDYIEIFSIKTNYEFEGCTYSVIVKSLNNNMICFDIEWAGINYSPLYIANDITAEVKNNICDFEWQDSWGNSGIGTLEIFKNYCTIEITQTKSSDWNRGSLQQGDGKMTLPSINIETTGTIYNILNQQGSDKSGDIISITINENKMSFNENPYIINGVTMVPMRAIFEALGANVYWNGELKQIKATKGITELVMYIENKEIVINGQSTELAIAPTIKNGSTMVPLRVVSEALGASVIWHSDTKTIEIFY